MKKLCQFKVPSSIKEIIGITVVLYNCFIEICMMVKTEMSRFMIEIRIYEAKTALAEHIPYS